MTDSEPVPRGTYAIMTVHFLMQRRRVFGVDFSRVERVDRAEKKRASQQQRANRPFTRVSTGLSPGFDLAFAADPSPGETTNVILLLASVLADSRIYSRLTANAAAISSMTCARRRVTSSARNLNTR